MSYSSSVLAVFLTGFVVKAIDDLLDEDEPLTRGLLAYLGKGAYIYVLLALLIACTLDFSVTFPLFSACYIVGMFSSWSMPLPFGLSSFGESIVMFFLSLIVAGNAVTIWSLLIIFSIHILDDLLDIAVDYPKGSANYALRWGRHPTIFVFLITLYSSVLMQPFLSVVVLCCTLIISEGIFKLFEEEDRDDPTRFC